jgi:low affinity Fe/Cu permease
MSRESDRKSALDAVNGQGNSASNDSPRRDHFGVFAHWTSRVMGGRWAFVVAFLTVVMWALAGPYFKYSQNWQLVINTSTTIVTFLMVFLIQNSQNRESKAVHLKLDELIFAVRQADNRLIKVETLTEEQLDRIAERYRELGLGGCDQVDQQIAEISTEKAEIVEKLEHLDNRLDKVVAEQDRCHESHS